MKQKWLINIYKYDTLFSQYKIIGTYKRAQEYANNTISKIPGTKYTITEIN